jgi:hypothetical protein
MGDTHNLTHLERYITKDIRNLKRLIIRNFSLLKHVTRG